MKKGSSMKRKLLFPLVLLTLFLWVPALRAEAVRLTGGQVLRGEILDESPEVIVIRTPSGVLTIEKKDILEIERKGQKSIAKVPKAPFSPLKGALMSFIPGYSGLYRSRWDYGGIPLSMLNAYYFVRFLTFQFTPRPVDFYHSTYIQERFQFANIPASAVNRNILEFTMEEQLYHNGVAPIKTLVRYAVMHQLFYKTYAQEYLVDTRRYTRDRLRDKRDRYLRYYFAYSSLNALLSYFALRYELKLRGRDGAGGTTFQAPLLYASITPDRGLGVGIAMRF